MATSEEIAALRLLIDEPSSTFYTDQMLASLVDQAESNLNAAASDIWQQKAARFSTLVDITESGSSRKMSNLYSNALAMAKHFADESAEVVAETTMQPRTRTAVRK
jgi:hypothetical protein